MDKKRQTFLVTGGAGFIGSHLSEALIEAGHFVRVLDDLSQGQVEWIPDGAELFEGDISKIEDCRKAVAGVNGVFHLAAMSKAGPSFEMIEECTRKNVVGTQNILAASREAGAAKLVYAASSTYYGNSKGPQTEEMPPNCLNPYALSKQVGELYCEFFDRVYGFPTISLRFFNVYGPRQPASGPYGLVMGVFLKQAVAGLPLEIHGTGAQQRDFIFVTDIVSALIAAWKSPCHGKALNVGSGTTISIKELADQISPLQIQKPRRPGDAEMTLADISQTKKELKWSPKIGLQEGIQITKLYFSARKAA